MALFTVQLPQGVVVNVYNELSADGISIGDVLTIQNRSRKYEILISDVASEPSLDDPFNSVPPQFQATNESGDVGFWAVSMHESTFIVVSPQ